jgi:anaerobic selenocysteine-containing dehydrogenase
MNATDLAARGLKAGDLVDVAAVPDGPPCPDAVLRRQTVVAYDIPAGSAGAYYPEANVLIPLAHFDQRSGTPSYKSVPVRVAASA